jgi:hypothetical protein
VKWKRAYPDSEVSKVHLGRAGAPLGSSTTALQQSGEQKKGLTYSHTLRGLLHPLQLLLIHNCGECDCGSASFLNAARKRTDGAGESPELLDGRADLELNAVSAIVRDFLSKSNQV